jgi:hypothetical protein
MRQADDGRRPDPEHHLLNLFEGAGVSDILDAFGDPDGEFAEEPGARPTRGGADGNARAATNDGPFPDIPDADALAAGSPVDPASPPDGFHGTDLLNGAGGMAEEDERDR